MTECVDGFPFFLAFFNKKRIFLRSAIDGGAHVCYNEITKK